MALLKLAAILLAGGATLVPAATATTSTTSGAHQSAASASSTSTSVLLDCAGAPQTRPGTYMLACGDGNNYLTGVQWSTWSADSATAKATDQANDCTPYCAVGHFHGYPVDVRLDEPVPWTGHPGEQRFSRLTLDYPGARPPGMPAHFVWPLPKPANAVAGT
ncbi:hypothetical protein DN069_19840 [Streptacidiphilus pinicola]|uniref:Secreted protein n=1 Tax=Streptacidiphilus pinicola TaxID=2219663 RepID=A0A2X0IFN1_9ACTN|nr:hypothetical protein [Streptacidiphilus pinicola]RAG83862.1 hypothetical protein DN069_19840 [Streptacidiphilus pinicola]